VDEVVRIRAGRRVAYVPLWAGQQGAADFGLEVRVDARRERAAAAEEEVVLQRDVRVPLRHEGRAATRGDIRRVPIGEAGAAREPERFRRPIVELELDACD